MFEQLKNPAQDDLHPAPPPATASSLALTWHQGQKSRRGFRESVARTPQGEIPQIEVSAWVQIPYVLQRLGAGPVKVVFPPGQDDAARAEQAGIKEFLRSRHRTSLELLFPLIEDQIASSASFAALDLMPPDIIKSAQDWLEAHQLRGYSERILRATDLLSAPGTPGAPLADFRSRAATAIAEHLSSNRPLVFTVPAGADCVAIAESLQSVCNESSEGERAKDTVRVWTPTGAGDTHSLVECSLGNFIDTNQATAPAAADTAAPSAAESPAPSGSEPALPNGETGEDSQILQQVDFGEEPENEVAKQVLPAVPEQDAGTRESAPGVGEASNTDVLANSQTATAGHFLDAANLATVETELQVAVAGSPSSSENVAQPQVASKGELVRGQLFSCVVKWVDRELEDETKEGAKTVVDFARRLAMARASRTALDVEAPKYETTYLCSEGGHTELAPKAGRAQEILKEVAARSMHESADLLFRALAHFKGAAKQAYNPNLSTQMGDLVLLPNSGHALFFSDLEGKAAKLAELIDRYDLIERWERNEPVFLCILGDCVDRSHNGSLLIDFLLDLKLRHGFERHVVLVPGNHELNVYQNLENLTGGVGGPRGLDEEVKWTLVSDIFNRDFSGSNEPSEERQTNKTLESLCPQSALAFVGSQTEMDEATYRSRWGLYVLYLSVFQMMPKVIYSVKGLYSTHAGLPRQGAFEEIFQADTPIVPDPKKWFSLLTEVRWETDCERLIWDDLATKFGEKGEFIPQDDPRRMVVQGRPQFTLNDFNRFCDATGLSLMIRGHQNEPYSSAIKSNYPEKESIKSAGHDGRFYYPGWNVGNIVTVSHFGWGALLDLSIPKPQAQDVKWIINVERNGTAYRVLPKLPQISTDPDDLSREEWFQNLDELPQSGAIDNTHCTAGAAADTAAPSAAESPAPSGSEQAVPNNTVEDSQILQQVDFGEEPENEATKQALPAVPEQDAGTGESAPGVGEASNTDVLANPQTATAGHFLEAANLATAETELQVAVAGSPSSSENPAQPQVATGGETSAG